MDLKRRKLNAVCIPRKETVGLNGRRCQPSQWFGVALSVLNTEKNMKTMMKAWEEESNSGRKGNENYQYQKHLNITKGPACLSLSPPSGIRK
jgi:hypothetical protein